MFKVNSPQHPTQESEKKNRGDTETVSYEHLKSRHIATFGNGIVQHKDCIDMHIWFVPIQENNSTRVWSQILLSNAYYTYTVPQDGKVDDLSKSCFVMFRISCRIARMNGLLVMPTKQWGPCFPQLTSNALLLVTSFTRHEYLHHART